MGSTKPAQTERSLWRKKLHEVIFEADTPAGKLFDVVLLIAILLSVLAVSLETVEFANPSISLWLRRVEWFFTLLFTAEYALRIICVEKPRKYMTSFFGIVDLLSILPTYLTCFYLRPHSFTVLRSLRLLRVFRIFKLAQFLSEAEVLSQAIWEARAKVVVFFSTVLIAVTITGTAMYEIEGRMENSQFTSIPQSVYWAIVTMTTVGYGDVVPESPLGKFLSAILILLGYSLIIVPTGFVSAELVSSNTLHRVTTQACPHCMAEGHDDDALHCKFCGERL
jgi:voltage-gated potassium channel